VRATAQPGYAARIDRSRRQLNGLLTAALVCVGLALTAPSAMAGRPPTAPTAETGAAAVSGPASATLAGVVDPNGADTWYFFAYGVDRYDSRTRLARAGDGVDPVAVSAAVAGPDAGCDLSRAPGRLQPPRLRARRRRPLHGGRPRRAHAHPAARACDRRVGRPGGRRRCWARP
jgi:hypothetical protein